MKIKLFAFDLDGTLTQHKTPLLAKNRAALEKLARKNAVRFTAGLKSSSLNIPFLLEVHPPLIWLPSPITNTIR